MDSSISTSFSHKKINVVLDEMNYLLWKQQILLTVRSHRLERLLIGTLQSPSETILDNTGVIRVNDAFEDFVAQDSALASWLLSTIIPHLLPHFVDAESAAAVWSVMQQLFASRSTTAAMSLHCKLQSLRKGNDNMRVYLTRVKEVCDALASCGSAVSHVGHVASILKGLPREYQPFMAVITTMKETLSLDNLYIVLLDAEAQLAGFDEQFDYAPMAANVAERVEGQTAEVEGEPRFNASYVANSVTWLIDAGIVMMKSLCVLHLSLKLIKDSLSMHTTLLLKPQTWDVNAVKVVDSGATHHITPDAANVSNPAEFRGPVVADVRQWNINDAAPTTIRGDAHIDNAHGDNAHGAAESAHDIAHGTEPVGDNAHVEDTSSAGTSS
ncbi:hypothetical protein F3Y22_tig00116997pilonHSYRG00468 [Hibiscus syriacus]|uniref:Retrotransposon Copia-like N-terminal domain-containing protein n=1 Tax=Hibiscus syriacus TaxID=106335 RepID=A0A6A2XSG1_HIBSY|nr:hypothetical protein F3Y22_tig00116997pilonHSYRG00468 [Hibiscus syriacus]